MSKVDREKLNALVDKFQKAEDSAFYRYKRYSEGGL